MSAPNFKEYIGDGVYAEMDGYMIKLTTEREGGVVHVIYFEPEVYAALVDWVARVRAETAVRP